MKCVKNKGVKKCACVHCPKQAIRGGREYEYENGTRSKSKQRHGIELLLSFGDIPFARQ